MQRNSNVIEFYSYNQVVRIYRQRKREKRLKILNTMVNQLTSYRAKHIAGGLSLLVLLTVISLILKDPTALVFLSPICLGFMFIKEEM
jgi:hypothetical protein